MKSNQLQILVKLDISQEIVQMVGSFIPKENPDLHLAVELGITLKI